VLTVALAQYSDRFWFPSGSLAANVPARVFPESSNTFAPLWTDADGTIALPNPLNTDANGELTFWAEVGRYWIHIDAETFGVDVGMTHEQADLSTGLASGGNVTINGANPKALDIAPFIGYIVDNTTTSPAEPAVTRIDYPGGTVQLDAAAQTRTITWWLMDASQTITQQEAAPTNEQRRTHLILAQTSYDIVSGAIFDMNALVVGLAQPVNQLGDLMEALRPFSVAGNFVTANGANLSLSKSSGTIFSRSTNHFAGGLVTDNPHISTSAAQSPVTFRRILRAPVGPTPPLVTTIDPMNYDAGGVLTPVGGGSNTSTIQRVWMFASDIVAAQIVVQYGQATYNSLGAASAAVGKETFIPHPLTAVGTLIAYVAVIRTATDLSDSTQAVFIPAAKFAVP
jgi:hypothetical protein